MAARIYTPELLAEAVAASDSIMDVIRWFGKKQTGSLHNHLSRLIKVQELDTSHFTYRKNNDNRSYSKRKTADDILVLIADPLAPRVPNKYLTRALLERGVPYECDECGTSEWRGKPIILDVDHIDGNPLDCRLENVHFLCPNCHRQTPTYGSKKASPVSPEQKICECGRKKQAKSKICSVCYAERKAQQGVKAQCQQCPATTSSTNGKLCADCYHKSTKRILRPDRERIVWPSMEELLELVQSSNYVQAGKTLGVTDSAVRKRLKAHGYDTKTFVKLQLKEI